MTACGFACADGTVSRERFPTSIGFLLPNFIQQKNFTTQKSIEQGAKQLQDTVRSYCTKLLKNCTHPPPSSSSSPFTSLAAAAMAAAEHRCAINHLHTDKKTSCTSHFDYFHLTLARRPVCECVETSSFISLVYKCIKKNKFQAPKPSPRVPQAVSSSFFSSSCTKGERRCAAQKHWNVTTLAGYKSY